MNWVPASTPDGDVHVIAVRGVSAFPPGRSAVSRPAIERAFRRTGRRVKGPILSVGIDITADDGQLTKMILALTPDVAAALVAAIESAGVDRGAVHAARVRLASP